MNKQLKIQLGLSILFLCLAEIVGTILFPLRWVRIIWLILTNGIAACFFIWQLFVLEKNQDELIKWVNENAEDSVKQVLDTMPVGIVKFNKKTKEKIWLNPFTEYIVSNNNEIISEREIKQFIDQDKVNNHFWVIGNKKYYFYLYEQQSLIYFFDVTNEQNLKDKIAKSQPVVGIISVDNYDDITEKMEEKEVANLNSYITSEIADYLKSQQAFSRKLNNEKYIFVTQYSHLKEMIEKKFDLLDKLRNESNEKVGKTITLSMGVSYGKEDIYSLGVTANNNLEIALVRGGDQVVVKENIDGATPIYFGGVSNSTVKRTMVRTRAMAMAFKGVVQETEEIYVMGHHFPDMDALASSIGVAYIAHLYNVPVYVILDKKQLIPDVERCLEEIEQMPELSKLIISPQKAISQHKENSLLVMVDHSNPLLSINTELYEVFKKIVVIDHHRRGAEFPDNPLLSYIETAASSVCELVTELIQYQSSVRGERLSRLEATLLLAGIIVDTRSFMIHTTSRTFDVASYLRTLGADSEKVQALFANDLSVYLKISGIVENSKFVREDIVVAVGEEGEVYDGVTIAKAADTLLSMTGIKASFVISRREDEIISISARSKGKINVQLIMEKMGGGGHFDNAAAQFIGVTLQEVEGRLFKLIDENVDKVYSVNEH
ncbi:MAG: DHH family phosphoesterase [Streptococcaceae bacterium]|jgi:c-di-AMP phosphodiesterase-like protein|nr:DHH family phosphoesterase [Streptococcaceae bacterium]